MNDNLITMSDIAQELGVLRATVWAWDQRRNRNGFPQHRGWTQEKRPRKLYERTEILEWYRGYTPSKGGAPKGNKNWQGKGKAVDR